ncbi:glycosyltransferase family 2 protein [Ruegeria sp. R13_0]|uniref:glycosyltransferase family 2 protein n=1 Tax=Ruegeria sp. R13_0 TaxID=2821099 RepID=UPI001ADAE29C|nr:glycosyltransferase family 2 protein [Ruegeria sp. R13_0]MBO9433421.1 glycosyltransferase family 2 protein [Ruegeria sp. R13_0]
MKQERITAPFRLAEDFNLWKAPIPALTIVIPAHNEEGNIDEAIARVHTHVTRLLESYEIIIVDDGSTDSTLSRAKALAADYPLRVLRLSRNFGKEQAIMAGLRTSRGKAVVILDADLQEPLSCLNDMWKAYEDGFEMVYTSRAHRADEPRSKRLLTWLFYKLLNLGSDIAIPPDSRDFRLMDRRVVDALCDMPESNRFMKGLYGWVGFRSKEIRIELEPRMHGTSKFRLIGLMKLALTGLTSFTTWPLRIWTVIGFSIAAPSIFYGFWIAVRTLVFGIDVPGWSTLAAAIFLLGGVQLVSVGILGEYVARVFGEVKGRPGFIVAEDFSPNLDGSP